MKYSVANALEDVGWKRPATSSVDAAAEWLYIDFELGCSGDFASFANMHYDYTTDHFTETEYIV